MADNDQEIPVEEPLSVADTLKSWQGVGGGPVPVSITPNEVQMMAMFMCPIADISAFFNISDRQLYRRFASEPILREAFSRGRAMGRRMIRRKQFEVAVKGGDVNMLKWLGQNVLGQSSRKSFISDELNPADMDDALDVEFEEIFEGVDEKLEAKGYAITDQSDKTGTDVPS